MSGAELTLISHDRFLGSPPEDLTSLDSEGLRRELSRSLGMTAEHLMRLAWIVRLLEERGEDLSDLRIGLLTYLRKIAHGQLVPEAIVRFGESPLVLQQVASLPLPDQLKLAAGDPVTLIVRGADGHWDHRLADPLRLTREQSSQVFGKGRIRDESEQILILESRGKPKEPQERPKTGRVKVDAKRGGIRIGSQFAPVADVVAALAALSGFGSDEDDVDIDEEEVPCTVKLTTKQHTSLKLAAARGRTDMSVLVRRALAAAGLFGHS